MKGKVIAIDGPAGAGKSTIAKMLAQDLGYVYIDTGAMYRACAWLTLQNAGGGDIADEDILKAVAAITIKLVPTADGLRVKVGETDVSEAIRTPEVTALVSRVAALGPVREKMVALQREMAVEGGVVMDGRDIASKVLPDADVKIFLTASIEERAERRGRELREKGYAVDMAKLQAEIAARDKADSERAISPLVRIPEAVLLDSTGMTVEEVKQAIIDRCE